MKKLLIYFVIVFVFLTRIAFALDLTWDQNTDEAVGYVFFWTDGTDTFNERLPGITTITYTIPENLFRPNVEYTLWVTAYDAEDIMSGPSNRVTYTREVETVPPDNLPTETHDPADAPENLI